MYLYIPSVGDHDAALLGISTTPQYNKPIKRTILLWNKADLSSLRYDFNMLTSNFDLQSFPDVNSCWTVFRNNVIQLMKKYVPNRITRSRKTNAWMNTETTRMVHCKNRASTKAQFTKSPLVTFKYTSISNQNVNELFGKLTIHTYKTLFAMMQDKIQKKIIICENQKTRCFRRCTFV